MFNVILIIAILIFIRYSITSFIKSNNLTNESNQSHVPFDVTLPKSVIQKFKEIRARSGLELPYIYLYSIAWLLRHMVSESVSEPYVDELRLILDNPKLTKFRVLDTIIDKAGVNLIHVELPTLLRSIIFKSKESPYVVIDETIVVNLIEQLFQSYYKC